MTRQQTNTPQQELTFGLHPMKTRSVPLISGMGKESLTTAIRDRRFAIMKMIFNINRREFHWPQVGGSGVLIRRLICLTLVASLVGFGGATLSTLHVHIMPDGRIVAHSHPLPDGDGKHEHRHSQQECETIQCSLRALEIGGLIADSEPPAELLVSGSFESVEELQFSGGTVPAASQRAPPRSLPF